MKTLHIDVKDIVREESPLLAKIPFVVRWFRKLLHEEEINGFISMYEHLHGAAFAAAALDFFDVKVEAVYKAKEKVSPQKRYIFAANHPLGGLDGVALIHTISERFPEVRFPVTGMLMHIENFQPIFIKIKRKGNQTKETLRIMEKVYASEHEQMLIFPAGLVSRRKKGKVEDLPWQKHFIMKAIQHQRDIVPVYIDGENSDRFYRLANLRQGLGLKSNLEKSFLPDEMFRQKHRTIRIVIGTPISYDILRGPSADNWADYVKRKVYELA